MAIVRKLNSPSTGGREVFHLVLLKPTRYHDDGYSVHWRSSPMPSNSLACVLALAEDARARQVLGPDVEICITPVDETAGPADAPALARAIRRRGAKALIGLVGVQSNQFPRAMDLARAFLAADLPVLIGGFHVTGSLAMLPEMPPEIAAAMQDGVSLFLGEAEEERLDEVLLDAYRGRLKPVYDHRDDLPGLAGQPVPLLPKSIVKRALLNIDMTCMDLGRGCPFKCSFCCIINVQGRKSRYRSADDLERILIANHRNGIHRYFITDDNFARNRNWEELFDRMIEVQRREGFRLNLLLQVDMLCHRIPGFIDKAGAAGTEHIFCGLESVNPENLGAMQKPQNIISEYRDMMLAWKRHSIIVSAGFIIGMPNDTRESVLRDVDTIKRELPVDLLNVSILTPLPGSQDHKELSAAGIWMDPDLNQYDLAHCVMEHPTMSRQEINDLFWNVWRRFYSDEHMETVFRRQAALGGERPRMLAERFTFYGRMFECHGIYSLDVGLVRLKYRNSRRPGLPIENPLLFYGNYAADAVRTFWSIQRNLRRAVATSLRLREEVRRNGYADEATVPSNVTTLPRPQKKSQPAPAPVPQAV